MRLAVTHLRRKSSFAALLLVITATVLAKDYSPPELPQVFNAKTYPIHEAHDDERVSVAVDPYVGSEKENILRVPYRKHDLLPVRLIITNDGNQPVSLLDLKIQFITAHNEKEEPATMEDIERRLGNAPRSPANPSPLPIPLPRKPKKRVDSSEEQEIGYLQFKAKAVEPHSSQAGFLFFDITGLSEPLAGTHIYLTGMRNGDGQELFYFDLPLAPAQNNAPAK